MNKNEKLLLAMSELDDDIIMESSVIESGRRFNFKKLSTIAATFIFVVGMALILRLVFTGFTKMEVGGDAEAAPENSSPGDCTEDYEEEEAELEDEEKEDTPSE